MMGVLKIVLGALGVAQLFMAALYCDKGYQSQHCGSTVGDSSKGTLAMAKFFMEQLAAFHIGLAAINILSWNMGSDMRPRVATANIMSSLGICVAYYRSAPTFPIKSFPMILSVVGTVAVVAGLVLHQMEPGLLTEDKTEKKSIKDY